MLNPLLFLSWSGSTDMSCGYDPVKGMEVCEFTYSPPPPPPIEIPPIEEPVIDYDDYDSGSGGGEGPPESTPEEDANKEECWQNATSKGLPTVTSDFGWRVLNNKNDFHVGWDIGVGAQSGHEALAIANVRILRADYDKYNGNFVEMEVIGTGEFIKYIHLDSVAAGVDRGDEFSTGDTLGIIGNTGQSGGIHLHMAIWDSLDAYNGRPRGATETEIANYALANAVDPAYFFNSSVCPMPSIVNSHDNTEYPTNPSEPVFPIYKAGYLEP